jgi:hypothetical protein
MRKLVIAAGLVALGIGAPATSANSDTVGYCLADIVYGNQPNMADGSPGGPQDQEPGSQAGNVLPSQSPGPFVNNPSDPDNPTRGRSVGGFMQDDIDIPALCREAFQ